MLSRVPVDEWCLAVECDDWWYESLEARNRLYRESPA